jgi:hypothetical protein
MYLFYINNVLLPVTPSKLSVKIKNQNKTVNLVDGSEYNVLRLQGLSEYSFDCLLPRYGYPFAQYEGEFLPPQYYLGLFETIKVNRQIATFRVLREENDGIGENIKCTVEDYTIKEDAANGADIVVSLKLKQYEYRKTTIIDFTDKSDNSEVVEKTERPIDKQPQTVQHTVAAGDTLWGIAKRYYGNGAGYTDIYNDNKDVIEAAARQHGRASSSGGWWIYPGTVLTVKDGIK